MMYPTHLYSVFSICLISHKKKISFVTLSRSGPINEDYISANNEFMTQGKTSCCSISQLDCMSAKLSFQTPCQKLLALFRGYCYLSRLMGKPTICICENKDADQLRGNREANQRLCFRYSDSTIPPLLNSKISSF